MVHFAIVGGSLTGLAAANVLYRLCITVSVFEKFPRTFEDRGSSLGFVDIGLWEYIRGSRMMRRGRHAHRSQGAYHYGDLWKYLYDGLPAGCVHFNHSVTDLGNDNMRPTIDGIVYDAVIVADGGWSTLRKYVNGVDKQPEYAGYIIYRAKLDSDTYFPNFQGEGAVMSPCGKYFAIALNVARDNGENYIMGGVAIGAPESDVDVVRPEDGQARHTDIKLDVSKVPSWFIPFVKKQFSHANPELVRWLEMCASGKGKITPQPLYEFMADNVVSGRIILMGDAAHMASPRTAAGAHTGMLDAEGLMEALTTYRAIDNLDAAIRAYEKGGKERARSLYLRSKQVSQPIEFMPGDRQDYKEL